VESADYKTWDIKRILQLFKEVQNYLNVGGITPFQKILKTTIFCSNPKKRKTR
jgi:hypothetical protein